MNLNYQKTSTIAKVRVFIILKYNVTYIELNQILTKTYFDEFQMVIGWANISKT